LLQPAAGLSVLLLIRSPPRSPLFPYTTLFRSKNAATCGAPTLPCQEASGGIVTMRQSEPCGGGFIICGSSSASRYCFGTIGNDRSEEHTSELQSLTNLVCRLLLEKKKHQRMRW